MKKTILFASTNLDKYKEIKYLLTDYNVINLYDINYDLDIEETGQTYKENAFIKASTISKISNLPIISDDSGLEVFSINNEPGIYSKRYSMINNSSLSNIELLLSRLKDVKDRKARYICSLCLYINKDLFFQEEGYVDGIILDKKIGSFGFEYDPIFYIPSLDKTMGELSFDERNKVSHRSKALEKLLKYIRLYV